MRATVTVLAATAGLALAPAACGGGSDGASATTKAEFIRHADAICQQADEKQKAARRTFWVGHPGVLGTKQFREEEVGWRTDVVEAAVLPQVQVEAEELARLPVPRGDRKEVGAIVKGLEKAVQRGKAKPSALIKNAVGPFAEVERLAREYGFHACANPL